jgi:cob(I)alamin adenosyltransferase
MRRLEPEIKIFHFEKSDENFEKLSEDKKKEEIINIKNGINFAKKVLSTGECDLLILDEILGLVEKNIISVDELKNLLECREETGIILTGITLNDEICVLADEVSKIETVRFKVF